MTLTPENISSLHDHFEKYPLDSWRFRGISSIPFEPETAGGIEIVRVEGLPPKTIIFLTPGNRPSPIFHKLVEAWQNSAPKTDRSS